MTYAVMARHAFHPTAVAVSLLIVFLARKEGGVLLKIALFAEAGGLFQQVSTII